MSHYLIIIFFVSIVCVFANIFTRPCLRTRINYRVHYTYEYYDRMALLRGEPSSFARTGFYDRLFRCLICYYTVLLRQKKIHTAVTCKENRARYP
uniref:Secreted protein n=1 Tax=Angiostrongylus cantonensis TaxID=6313 RepID=A0A0K0DGZ3_ANGCA